MKRTSSALILGAALSVSMLTSCTSSPEPAPTESVEFGELGRQGCDPPSPIVGQEVQGTGAASVTAFGEFQGVDAARLIEGTPIKLVVRITGSGDLSVDMTAPDGTAHGLDWGPEEHTGSNYDRPGDEWGTGFSFDAPGCWALNLRRDSGDHATIWLYIAAAPRS
jgi:hypothetical protein